MSSGPGVAALGIAFCLLGGAFGVSALYVPGIALLLLVGCAETSVRLAASRARLKRDPPLASVEEGETVSFLLRVEGRLPFGGGELSRWPGADFEPIRQLARCPISFDLRPERRGLHAVGPSLVRFRDPFAICSRSVHSAQSEVLVLPRTERISPQQLTKLSGLARSAYTPAGGAPGNEVDGLRAYRPGAPASRIHWPTVARTGTLVERRLHAETERVPLLVLDAHRPASVQALDMCVRAGASLCVGLARRGGSALLLPGAHRALRVQPDLRAWPALHARLALLQAGGEVSLRALERASIVLWVSAGVLPDFRSARSAGAVIYTVSPLPHAGPVLFSVAGCAVQPAPQGAATSSRHEGRPPRASAARAA